MSAVAPRCAERMAMHFVALPRLPPLPDTFQVENESDSVPYLIAETISLAMDRLDEPITLGTVVTVTIATRRADAKYSVVLASSLNFVARYCNDNFTQTQGLAIGMAANALLFQLRFRQDTPCASGHCLILAGRVVRRNDNQGFAFRFDAVSCNFRNGAANGAGKGGNTSASIYFSPTPEGKCFHYGFCAYELKKASDHFERIGSYGQPHITGSAFTMDDFESSTLRFLSGKSPLGKPRENFEGFVTKHNAKEARRCGRELYTKSFRVPPEDTVFN